MGRDASGVAGMKLRAGDEVIAVDIAADDADLLVVTENGYGKRTRVARLPGQGPRRRWASRRCSSSRARAGSPARGSSATATR